MELYIEPGTYVVAVSGGVDSVSLLNMLSKQKGLDLVVAHFDHGIRKNSAQDREFVKGLAHKYGMPFEYVEGKLGATASEATAREARYKFLNTVREKYSAKAIVTAHHQDDLLETAIINLLRGTGRKGLTALSSREGILRPLLHIPKKEILDYASEKGLEWREDSTNRETKYLRNYVRHELVPKLSGPQKSRLLKIIEDQRAVNSQLDEALYQQLANQAEKLDRQWFASLSHKEAKEIMAAWLRMNELRDFDKTAIERAVVGAKTAKIGKKTAVKKDIYLEANSKYLALRHLER